MAGPFSNPGAHFSPPSYIQAFRPASSMSANRFDEGYSEDTRSQSGSDTVMRIDTRLGENIGGVISDQDAQFPLPEWVMNMNETERSEFAYAILRSLRTSSIAGIVEKLNPLLHLDPVVHLPPEITFQIFSYLTPETLLRASTLSRTWRLRVMDSPLWKLLFRLEGWNSNFPQVRAFEESERARRVEMRERKTRARAAEDMDYENPSTKKRLRQRPLFGDGASADNSIRNGLEPLSLDGNKEGLPDWGEQHGAVEADESPSRRADDTMEGISYNSIEDGVQQPTQDHVAQNSRDNSIVSPITSAPVEPPIRPTLIVSPNLEPKINWQFLYKQKRRLEDNWDAGRFSNFQLPHPAHPREAHTECVYTIQYTAKHLVSGSRDKTVRVWNLETQRLMHEPLEGHVASVLCLQFDDRPEQDVIISGGSDCRVIMWRFSTGRIIKKIEKAHSESVLNLRFDDRYLVTCSKDKTIKVWNRKELWPTDDAYPSSTTKSAAKFPSYIIDMQHQVENAHLHYTMLQPYSLLMSLEGHGAAVNAIQILDGQIVSASGDRSVKVWDVRTGACSRTFTGHSKGIACVQFDGRRIVSGSSDETVRIFDRATGAEVACLHGHSNLVRTVQAQFGDFPGNEEELEAEARAVDRTFFEAKSKGLVNNDLTRAQRHARNAGSRDPRTLFAYGAKLPPGGGGSKWARIVSGSYDETVIIWKRGHDGAWERSNTLYQHEAVRAAGGRPRRPAAHNHAHGNQPGANQNPQQLNHAAQNHFQAIAQQAQAQAQAAATLAQQAQALHAASNTAQGGIITNTTGAVTTITATQNAVQGAAAQASGNQGQTQHQPAGPAPVINLGAAQQQQQGAAQAGGAGAHHHHHHHHHPFAGPLNNQGTNSRVFKLQFDARRIICCSQDPTIVGWDFANNDPDIILASQFFGESD
ncbi:WD40 repeat-like protein [Aaosphaeria arxii CBS 175.79]|uniref:Mitochondrial division protein 1 n=1 Tax=Aaosphaeria arxii CBS 175.79 TaxID=1450172 RepID=A0A6A5Y574_9PLEO|nr:WD40 repeat-like protein [Aaosphaeria arxii CBS 175.79]KAF2020712.1 WD40 repeat-like protein [Aaosphaeria arxii CBS 175.79]